MHWEKELYLIFHFEDFWSNLCDMKIYSQDDKSAVLGYGDNQVQMIGNSVTHFGFNENCNS